MPSQHAVHACVESGASTLYRRRLVHTTPRLLAGNFFATQSRLSAVWEPAPRRTLAPACGRAPGPQCPESKSSVLKAGSVAE